MTLARAAAALVLLPLRRPIATAFVLVLATVAALFGWRTVRFEPDVKHLLPADHPHVRIAELLADKARPARALWVLLRADDVAARMAVVAARLRESPLVADVATTRDELLGATAARIRSAPLWFLAPEQRERLAATLAPEGRRQAFAALKLDLADDPIAGREVAVRDPLGVRWLLHDAAPQLGFAAGTDLALLGDRRSAVLRVTGTTDAYDADRAAELMAHVEGALRGEDHDVFGGYAVAAADQARLKADFERASWCSVAAIALYLCWVMRGVRLPLLVQVPALLSITWAVPLGNAWFGPLPTVAVAAVAVLCGLGVDFAIHYAARYRDERLAHPHRSAVLRTQQGTAPELLIDMATTAVTFLAIGGGQLAGLGTFGLLLATGLVCSVFATLTALPLLLAFAGTRSDPERSWLASIADRRLDRRSSRRTALAVVAVIAVAAIGARAWAVPMDADPDRLRPADDPVAAARAAMERQLGFSTVPVALLLPADGDTAAQYDALTALRAAGTLRFWTGLEPAESARVRSDVAAFRIADADLVAAAARDLADAGLEPEPFLPALRELHARLSADPVPATPVALDLDGTHYRVVTAWPRQRLAGRDFAAFTASVQERLGERTQVHGGPSVAASLEVLLAHDLARACGIAALLALVMVALWLRSLRLGLLALLPSAIGLAVVLLSLRAIDLPLTLVSFVAVPFVLGIGVDEGVHMVGRFRHGAATTGAIGVGVVRTSIGTVLGFASLLLATSPGLRELGAIVGVGSAASMLACLFVQAPLARWLAVHQSRAQQNQ